MWELKFGRWVLSYRLLKARSKEALPSSYLLEWMSLVTSTPTNPGCHSGEGEARHSARAIVGHPKRARAEGEVRLPIAPYSTQDK